MEIETTSAIPTSPQTPSEVKTALDEMMRAFEAFKEANDTRLEEIEKRQQADTLTETKVDRINERLSQLNAAVQRPALDTERAARPDDAEHRAAFRDYIRSGEAAALDAVQHKAIAGTTDAEGAYLIPDQVYFDVSKRLDTFSPIRKLARVQRLTQGGALSLVRPTDSASATWVAEKESRSATLSTTMKEFNIPLAELYANPSVSLRFLQDSSVDIESWLTESLAELFAATENEAFIDGTGKGSSSTNADKPKGILKAARSSSVSSKTAVVEYKTRASNGFPSSNPTDLLVTLAFGLPSRHRRNAVWLMNGATHAAIRKMKDSSGNYIWTPSFAQGQPSHLLGHPVYEESNMEDLTNRKTPIAFGDFHAGYMIVEHAGITILRDPYSHKPYVSFYAVRRVGGDVVDPTAYRVLTVGS